MRSPTFLLDMSSGSTMQGLWFILPEDEREDYFVHYSSIIMEGYKTLKADQLVSFEMVDGPTGTHAVKVQPVNPETDFF